MITRRGFFRLLGLGAAAALCAGAYATLVEPLIWRRIKRDRLALPGWPQGSALKLAILSDIHACEPWMNVARLERIVTATNALGADMIVMLGDFTTGMRLVTRRSPPSEWAPTLARLSAPLGVHAVLGNHDWWEDADAQRRGAGPTAVGEALSAVGIHVMENDAIRIEKDGYGFWLAGLGDQIAILPHPARDQTGLVGVDDLDATLSQVTTDEPVILLAHEPDIFPKVPDRVALTLSGHTHGGQVRLFGWAPVVPSDYGNRYAYGHVVEEGRHLLVSGGLGLSILPVRFGMPPEINLVEITA